MSYDNVALSGVGVSGGLAYTGMDFMWFFMAAFALFSASLALKRTLPKWHQIVDHTEKD